MKLDETAKVASIVSLAVGVLISVSGYVTNMKLRSLEDRMKNLDAAAKGMDVSKKEYDLSARLIADFSLPLARSFAIQYSGRATAQEKASKKISFPTSRLSEEFTKVLSGWEGRRGLMTGKACEQEGLKARQVVTLIVKNIGHADAVEVSIKAMEKEAPDPDPSKRWQDVAADGRVLPYYDLPSSATGWVARDMPIGDLRGLSSPEEDRIPQQVVLASVSGTNGLFGTILVPVEISWTDRITKNRQTLPIAHAQTAALRADLMGAEIGSVGSACR